MIEVPANALHVTNDLVSYLSEFRGKTYVNFRKTYFRDGVECIKNGFTISIDQWSAIKDHAEELTDSKYFVE